MDSALLLPALIGIIPGTLALLLLWKNRRADAMKAEAEYKDIEDQITERVLARAKKEINGLTLENEKVTKELEDVKKDRTRLNKRVLQLEAKCRLMKAEQDKLEQMFGVLRDGMAVLCHQLSDAGIEPAFSIEELDGGD